MCIMIYKYIYTRPCYRPFPRVLQENKMNDKIFATVNGFLILRVIGS